MNYKFQPAHVSQLSGFPYLADDGKRFDTARKAAAYCAEMTDLETAEADALEDLGADPSSWLVAAANMCMAEEWDTLIVIVAKKGAVQPEAFVAPGSDQSLSPTMMLAAAQEIIQARVQYGRVTEQLKRWLS